MHPGQLTIDAETVRALVDDQFPRWSGLPVTAARGPGTGNALFRIGDRLGARFPLQPGDVDDTDRRLRAEADAARELLGRTSVPTPEPVAIGAPGHGYPLPWSVQTWLPGRTAFEEEPGRSFDFAHDLAAFVAQVRGLDVRGRTFAGPGRGGDLTGHDAWLETCFRHSESLLDVPVLRRTWSALRELPRRAPDVMTHGDLVAGNVLVAGGRLTGVLDVGGLGPADPALDLVGAWHLLEDGPRRAFRADLGCDDLEWARGRGWAFEQAMGLVWYYPETNPPMSAMGRRTLARLLAEA
jgi:aminoglycoside phosphotransferase (APT) family kinase protein